MDKLYILVESGGEYSESWTHNHLSSDSRDYLLGVEAAIKRNREAYIKNCETLREVYYAEQEAWYKANPDRLDFKTRPKWKSGLRKEDITDAMKAERQAVDDHNEMVGEFNGQNLQNFYDHWVPMMNKMIAGFEPLQYVESYVSRWNGSVPASAPNYGSFEIETIDFVKG